jgi:hypothetical protein
LTPAGAASVAAPAPPLRGAVERGAQLKLYLSDTRQLFNSMDPAPFSERDLDPKAVAYIVDWAQEAPTGVPLAMLVHLGHESADDAQTLSEAVHEYFRRRAVATRRQLRKLFRIGRISLVIGLAFLASALLIGEVLAGLFTRGSFGWLLKESFVIGGWVALWRPIEIFLYDWWPIRAEANLYDRLGEMDVSVHAADAVARAAS